MLKTIIIEDEEWARELIGDMLRRYDFIELAGQAAGISDGIELIKQTKPALVLLDINLRDGSGFDLLHRLDLIDFKLIFITAYDKYAIDAIKFSAIDYLMKPVSVEDFDVAIMKAYKSVEQDSLSLKLNALFNNFKHLAHDSRKIVLNTSGSVYLLNVNDIIRCQADMGRTQFYLTNNESLVVANPLKIYDEMLSPYGFFRVHNSHLVNLQHVYRYDKSGKSLLVMKDKSIAPVSVSRKEELLHILKTL
jgi:two-component system, LytTR family, response regulator